MIRPPRALARALWQMFAVLFLLLAGTAQAAMPARPTGPVLDQAQIIPDDQEAALTQRLSAYNAQTGRSVVVATVASLDDQDVDSYANELFRAWGIGGKQTDQGLLFLIAPNERKVRIEVGLGLEEYLPDVLAGRILSGAVTPRFKQGDYAGGINAGVEQILTQLSRNPADAKAVAEAAAAARKGEGSGGSVIASAIFWIVLIVVLIAIFGRRNRGYVQRRSGIDPGIVLWGISEIARAASDNNRGSGWSSGGGSDWSGGGGFGGFGGGDSGGGGASGDW
ncbi:YgcG family protein [Novosphingobium sp. ERN07]|uniref:TPM domain-containing protein n=1 Tax=Novosphingobium sp. ERN07 TaxID=2726187 RepID=UPI001F11773A|nr:TPM domain-containing protein [Novosphingobium sp. ERN07]